jgi:hypothetical protein
VQLLGHRKSDQIERVHRANQDDASEHRGCDVVDVTTRHRLLGREAGIDQRQRVERGAE